MSDSPNGLNYWIDRLLDMLGQSQETERFIRGRYPALAWVLDHIREERKDEHEAAPAFTPGAHVHSVNEEQFAELLVNPLDEAQDARTTALYHARELLERKGGVGVQGSAPASLDLVRVAEWIIGGKK